MRTKETERVYRRNHQREKYHRRRGEALEQLGGECVRCGTTERLQFDHVDPSSKLKPIILLFASGSQTLLEAELEKCQLLCISCHTRKSNAERE